jgi:hypothetical protein
MYRVNIFGASLAGNSNVGELLPTQDAKRHRVPVYRRHNPAATRQGNRVCPGTAS